MIINDEWATNLGFECEHEVNSSILLSYDKIIELYEFL